MFKSLFCHFITIKSFIWTSSDCIKFFCNFIILFYCFIPTRTLCWKNKFFRIFFSFFFIYCDYVRYYITSPFNSCYITFSYILSMNFILIMKGLIRIYYSTDINWLYFCNWSKCARPTNLYFYT